MKGLLKCYYGYRNRGDELLFWGVVKYIFDHNDNLTSLDVEVGDVSWMNQWCELNHDLWQDYKSRVRFVPSRRFSMRIADYDIIYLGGGEVLAAQTRNFWHGGVNYLMLFWRWIWTRRVVWLGGIETPTTWWSKVLYRMMLPFAREIVCREQGSYDIARRYTDRVVLYHDWAIDVLSNHKSQTTNHSEKVPYFKCTDEVRGVRDGVETRPRRTIQAIIKNKNSEEYLLIEREIDGLRTFVGGGVEDGETELEALVKEIREEVGFDDVNIKQQVGGEVHRYFYHALKGYNNYTVTTCYLVEVDRDNQGAIDPKELEKHHPIWVSQEDILNQLDSIDSDNAYFFRLYQGMDVCELEWVDGINDFTRGLIIDKKIKVILLHGMRSPNSTTPNKWMLRCAEQLKQEGYEVYTPFLERSQEVGRMNWKQTIDQYADLIDEHTILAGHSAGGAAIVRWLGENHRNIKKLILVAPGYIPRPYEEGRISIETEGILVDNPDAGMRDLYNFEIDRSIVNHTRDGIIIFASNDSDRILQSVVAYESAFGMGRTTLADRGHFNDSYGPQNEIFPELVEEIIDCSKQRADYRSAPTQEYILINFIPKHTSSEIIAQFHEWIKDYPECQIINFPAEEGDVLPEEIVTQYGDRIQTWKRWEHDVRSNLTLFEQTQAGFGQRLHFIIPCVYYRIPIYRLAYSEKVNKILQYFDSKEL